MEEIITQKIRIYTILEKSKLEITATASAIDPGIQKKTHGSGTTTLIIWNKEINDIIKIVEALEDSNVLLKGVTETNKNKTKKKEGGFLGILASTLGSILLGNLLSRKEIVRAGSVNKKGKGFMLKLIFPTMS